MLETTSSILILVLVRFKCSKLTILKNMNKMVFRSSNPDVSVREYSELRRERTATPLICEFIMRIMLEITSSYLILKLVHVVN